MGSFDRRILSKIIDWLNWMCQICTLLLIKTFCIIMQKYFQFYKIFDLYKYKIFDLYKYLYVYRYKIDLCVYEKNFYEICFLTARLCTSYNEPLIHYLYIWQSLITIQSLTNIHMHSSEVVKNYVSELQFSWFWFLQLHKENGVSQDFNQIRVFTCFI